MNMLPFIPNRIKRTLEFGCSDGNFSKLVKEKFNTESWGIDINESCIANAKEYLDRAICGDADSVLDELPQNYFDCVICNDFLEHLTYPDKFIAKIKKHISPGGYIVASIPNVRSWGTFVLYFYRKDWKYTDSGVLDYTHFRFFTKKNIIDLFQNRGFTIEKIEGLNPTRSAKFKLLNIVLFGFISDMRYLQYAVRAKLI